MWRQQATIIRDYNEATSEPCGPLYYNLTKSDINEAFMKKPTHRIMVSDDEEPYHYLTTILLN